MENSDIIELAKQFSKAEISQIADELSLDKSIGTRSTVIIQAIVNDLDENGVPEMDDCSSVLMEFMQSSGYVDENGNLLDVVEEGLSEQTNDEPTQQIVSEADVPAESLPECFKLSIADDRDPSCNRCRVFAICHTNRMSKRPECYGLYFDQRAEECQACIEAYTCRIATQAQGD